MAGSGAARSGHYLVRGATLAALDAYLISTVTNQILWKSTRVLMAGNAAFGRLKLVPIRACCKSCRALWWLHGTY